jgi:multiple sugar transport system permease protein
MSATVAVSAGRRKSFLGFTSLDLMGYAFISPWLIGFLIFEFFPFFASLYLSVTDWGIVGTPNFVGLQNYQGMVDGSDFKFSPALRATAYFAVVAVPGNQIIALLLAMLLSRKSPGIAVFRTFFYIPAIASGVGTAYLWAQIFSTHGGLLNSAFEAIGLPVIPWLYSLTWSMPALIIIALWNSGQSMLIYLAALQGVPQTLYDAAACDGAGPLGQFRHVTVPSITPAMFFNIVLGFIGSFQVFTTAFVITQGGPGDATLFYTLYLFQVAFQDLRMGYAAALAWVLFLIIMVITVIQLTVSRYWVYYEGGTGIGGGPR